MTGAREARRRQRRGARPGDRCLGLVQADVFTPVALAGNPAGVVLDADGLTAATMQAVARELNVSETAFVFRDADDGAVPVRFFTPTREVPVCGHATLAAHAVRAARMGHSEGAVVQRSAGGTWRVRWRTRDGHPWVVMAQGPVVEGPAWAGDRRRDLLAALGLDEGDLVPGWPVQVLSTGHAKAMVPVAERGTLRRLTPDLERLTALGEATGVHGVFAFTPRSDRSTDARVFAPGLGIPEDPVNGSGHGPLAAYLARRSPEWVEAVARGFRSRMGEALGRPGEVWVRRHPNRPDVVEVGGFVTVVFHGSLCLPPCHPATSKRGDSAP